MVESGARDSRFKFQQRHLFRLTRIDNVYKFIAVIRLKASFQFFTDENLKRTEKKLWQSVLVLILFP